jgi:hypothetical protein
MTLFELACFTFAMLMMLQIRDWDASSVALGWNFIQYVGDDSAKLLLNLLELTVVDLGLSVFSTSQASHAINLKAEDKLMRIHLPLILRLKLKPDAYSAHRTREPFLINNYCAGGTVKAEVDAISAHLFFVPDEGLERGVSEFF